MKEIITSKIYSLNKSDLLKAALIATLTPVLVLIQNSLDSGSLTFDWKALGMAAIGGFLAYLTKNFFTPSKLILPVSVKDQIPDAIDNEIKETVSEHIANPVKKKLREKLLTLFKNQLP